MDRARDFTFVKQLPRHTTGEVAHQEQVHDRQVLLNETWPAFCQRKGMAARVHEEHEKWVTETWEDWEERTKAKLAALAAHDEAQDKIIADNAAAAADRRATGEAVIAAMLKNERLAQGRLRPPVHALCLDFAALRAQRESAERGAIEDEETARRLANAAQEADERAKLRAAFMAELTAILDELERRRAAAEAEQKRRLEEQQRLEAERRAATERQRLEAEEAEKRRRDAEEKARLAERRRKDDERRAKAKAEREARMRKSSAAATVDHNAMDSMAALQAAIAARTARDARQAKDMQEYLDKLRERAAAAATDDEADALCRAVPDELAKVFFNGASYLAAPDKDTAAAAGTDVALKYIAASANCNAALRSGTATLADPTAPTLTIAVGAASAVGPELYDAARHRWVGDEPSVANASAHRKPSTTAAMTLPAGNTAALSGFHGVQGDYAAVAIRSAIASADDPADEAQGQLRFILCLDTLSSNPTDRDLEPAEAACYPLQAPVSLPTSAGHFLTEVGAILGGAYGTAKSAVAGRDTAPEAAPADGLDDGAAEGTAEEKERAAELEAEGIDLSHLRLPPTSSLAELYRATCGAIRKAVPDADCYVARLPRPDGSSATVVCHNGFLRSDPATGVQFPSAAGKEDLKPGPRHLLACSLDASAGGATFADLRDKRAGEWYAPDVAVDSRAALYAKPEDADDDDNATLYATGPAVVKQAECLLLAPLRDMQEQLTGAIGITRGGGKGLDDDVRAALLAFIAGDVATRLRAQIRRNLRTDLAMQAAEWLEVTLGRGNVHIALKASDDRGAEPVAAEDATLAVVAASERQRWLIGKEWQRQDGGVGHGFLAGAEPVQVLDDITAVQDPAVKLWDPRKAGTKAALLMAAIEAPVDDAAIIANTGKGDRGRSSAPASGPASRTQSSTRGGGAAGSSGGDRVGVVYVDTMDGGPAFEQFDQDLVATTATLLGQALRDLDSGAPDAGLMARRLAIEDLVDGQRIRFLKLMWAKVTQDVNSITGGQLSEMARYNAPPPIIPTTCSALMVLLGTNPKAVASWENTRKKIAPALLERIGKFDPTGLKPKGAFIRRARRMTKGTSAHDVFTKGSYPASCFFSWAFVTLLLRRASDMLRRNIKRGLLDASPTAEAEDRDDAEGEGAEADDNDAAGDDDEA